MPIERIVSWSAFVLACAALIFVIMFTVNSRYESGYNARVMEDQSEAIKQARAEIEVWRVYIETMRSSMVARGINVPPPPQPPYDKVTNPVQTNPVQTQTPNPQIPNPQTHNPQH